MPIENEFGEVSRVSKWHNPTPYTRKVRICMNGHYRTVRWAPGETIELDSQYDRAIQIVFCQEDECNGRGPKINDNGLPTINCQPCTRGHSGQIMGGQDPLLVRMDMGDIPNPQLDPDEVARQQILAEAKKIAQNQKAIQAALLQANLEAEKEAKTPEKPSGKKPAPQPQPQA